MATQHLWVRRKAGRTGTYNPINFYGTNSVDGSGRVTNGSSSTYKFRFGGSTGAAIYSSPFRITKIIRQAGYTTSLAVSSRYSTSYRWAAIGSVGSGQALRFSERVLALVPSEVELYWGNNVGTFIEAAPLATIPSSAFTNSYTITTGLLTPVQAGAITGVTREVEGREPVNPRQPVPPDDDDDDDDDETETPDATGISAVVQSFLKQLLQRINTAVETAVGGITVSIPASFSNVITTLQGEVTKLRTAVTDWADDFRTEVAAELGKAVTKVGTALSSPITAVGTAVTNAFTNITSVIRTIFNNIKTVVETAYNNVKTALTTALTGLGTTVSTALTSIRTTMSTVLTNLGTDIKALATKIATTFTSLLTTVQSGLTDVANKIKTGLNNLVTTLANNIAKIVAKVGDIGEDITDKIDEWAGSVKPSFLAFLDALLTNVSAAVNRAEERYTDRFT